MDEQTQINELINKGVDPATAAQIARSAMWQTKYDKTNKDIDRNREGYGNWTQGKYAQFVPDYFGSAMGGYRAGQAQRDQPGLIKEGEDIASKYAEMLMGKMGGAGPSQSQATVAALRGGDSSGMGATQQPNVGTPQRMPMASQPMGAQGPSAQTMPAQPPSNPMAGAQPLPGNGQITPQMLEQLKMSNPERYAAIMGQMGA